uniref:Uncharacterized protein n=1 Tax=Rhizophora mucronata TaxID=61149 RepID=A0A2P2MYY4_RHIMU
MHNWFYSYSAYLQSKTICDRLAGTTCKFVHDSIFLSSSKHSSYFMFFCHTRHC